MGPAKPKKNAKIASYLKASLPSTKFILQPTDIQKMKPALEIMEDLELDRIPKILRKKRAKRRRRKKRKKWKIQKTEGAVDGGVLGETANQGGYSLIDEREAKLIANKQTHDQEDLIHLPGIGTFKTRSIYSDDLIGHNAFRAKKQEKIGGMDRVIKRFDLTANIEDLGKVFGRGEEILTSRSEPGGGSYLPVVRHAIDDKKNAGATEDNGDGSETCSVDSNSSNSQRQGREQENRLIFSPITSTGEGDKDQNQKKPQPPPQRPAVPSARKERTPRIRNNGTRFRQQHQQPEHQQLSIEGARASSDPAEIEVQKMLFDASQSTGDKYNLHVLQRRRTMCKKLEEKKRREFMAKIARDVGVGRHQEEESDSSSSSESSRESDSGDDAFGSGRPKSFVSPLRSEVGRGGGVGYDAGGSVLGTNVGDLMATGNNIGADSSNGRNSGDHHQHYHPHHHHSAGTKGAADTDELEGEDQQRGDMALSDNDKIRRRSSVKVASVVARNKTILQLRAINNQSQLEIQQKKNFERLMQEDEHLRRHSMLLGGELDDETKAILHTRLVQRWMTQVQIVRGADFFSKQCRLLKFIREKKAAEEGKIPESVHVHKRHMKKYGNAIRVIQAKGRDWSDRLYQKRKTAALVKLQVLLKKRIHTYKYFVRDRAADTIAGFVRDTKFNFAVFATVVNQFRKSVIASQRMARNFIACRRARYDILLHFWNDMEKLFIRQYKMKRKTTEEENKAMITNAPIALRNELVYNLLTSEMRRHMEHLTEFEKRRVWIENQMKKVDIEDARAVVKGESREIKREKMVLKLPFYNLFTRITKVTMLNLIKSAHDQMDKFQKNMNRETGMALLQRADDVLAGLQKELAKRRRASISVQQISETDMDNLRGMGCGEGGDGSEEDESNYQTNRRGKITTFTSLVSDITTTGHDGIVSDAAQEELSRQRQRERSKSSGGTTGTHSKKAGDSKQKHYSKLPGEEIDFNSMTNGFRGLG